MDKSLRQAAIEYHRLPTAAKIAATPTNVRVNQRDAAEPGIRSR